MGAILYWSARVQETNQDQFRWLQMETQASPQPLICIYLDVKGFGTETDNGNKKMLYCQPSLYLVTETVKFVTGAATGSTSRLARYLTF